MYRKAKFPHCYAPRPCWIPPSLRHPPRLETEPPTFIGSSDILRCDLLGRAMQAGADFIVYGNGWTTQSGASPPERIRSHSYLEVLRNQVTLGKNHGIR